MRGARVCLLWRRLTGAAQAVRETLNTYLASYLYSLGATDSEAAALSALMPFFGAPATLICGVLFDCVPHRWCAPLRSPRSPRATPATAPLTRARVSPSRRGAIVPIMFTPAFVAVLLIVLLPDPSIDTLSKCISVVCAPPRRAAPPAGATPHTNPSLAPC